MNNFSKTPIADFIDSYIKSDFSRLHMPGHKGQTDFEAFDITEIKGADSLYEANGIIAESEDIASKIFGTDHTFYSTEGSSQCIKAMLFLAVTGRKQKDKRPLVLAARNVHKAFIRASALIDFDVEWLMPETTDSICSCTVSADSLRSRLSALPKKPCAVYITSPDYLGNIAQIKQLSKVCKEFDIPLLVDNAHGAYLKFANLHPIDLGADMCCDSAHKTLPVLTGGAYLHIKNKEYIKSARLALGLFGSTSPSYLILRSLDLANKYISEEISDELKKTLIKLKDLLVYINEIGLINKSAEPLKITLSAQSIGYSGFEIDKALRAEKIESEYADENFVVLMFSTKNSDEDFDRIKKALGALNHRESIKNVSLNLPKPKQKTTIREAYFSKQIEIDANGAENKICGISCVSCPPAIPIAISGELITKEHIKLFKKYGIKKINVLA